MCAAQIAAGFQDGTITVFDVSGRELLPVNRFKADEGPVTLVGVRCMAKV